MSTVCAGSTSPPSLWTHGSSLLPQRKGRQLPPTPHVTSKHSGWRLQQWWAQRAAPWPTYWTQGWRRSLVQARRQQRTGPGTRMMQRAALGHAVDRGGLLFPEIYCKSPGTPLLADSRLSPPPNCCNAPSSATSLCFSWGHHSSLARPLCGAPCVPSREDKLSIVATLDKVAMVSA